ncbi:MAG: hypothetical protein A2033_14490 [Bacteroidetes bacterium GWA2_31_9]|nr:MAG: hypothetical protein A2033_14490 [Bacteroidetes bacterium GWA2_31_9]
MRLKNILLFLILFFFLIACEPPVLFNEPQPSETKSLLKFPRHLIGNYLSFSDNSVLKITEKTIVRIYNLEYNLCINELDKNLIIKGDSLININTNKGSVLTKNGDSLIVKIQSIDTLFKINNNNVLKKFKGYYFISTLVTSNSWEVKKIMLSQGQLTISSITNNIEIDDLMPIKESRLDSIPPYKFNPTKKQFKEFVKSDGFCDNEIFIRQNRDANRCY